jgi:TPR repeat protein
MAPSQGRANAQYQLGLLYEQGEGVVAPDAAQAARWYRLAAYQGEPAAQARLALMYRDGRGVAPDNVLAFAWLGLALEGATDRATREQAARAQDALREGMGASEIAAGKAKIAELRSGSAAPEP